MTRAWKFVWMSSLTLNALLIIAAALAVQRVGLPRMWRAVVAAPTSRGVPAYTLERRSVFASLPTAHGGLVFLGDSLTQNGPWDELAGDARIRNRGIRSDTIDWLLPRLRTSLKGEPDKVFVMIGINDLLGGESPSHVIAAYRDLVSRIRREAPDAALYLESILPTNIAAFRSLYTSPARALTNGAIREVNAGIRQIAVANGATYLDLYPGFLGADGRLRTDWTDDGVHLNGPGYLHWWRVLRPYVEATSPQ